MSGSSGFGPDYWEHNYSAPQTMDGIANAKEHARYLRALFRLEFVDISSVVDLGAGLGELFHMMLKAFLPYRACAVEPSSYAFEILKQKKYQIPDSTQLSFQKKDILTWAKYPKKGHELYDLGICNSVWQYLEEEELDELIPLLAQRVNYLYLAVPTDRELKRQVEDLNFHDTYAFRRSKTWYLHKIKPYFTIVGNRLLESKFHLDEQTSPFSDLLFRL